MTSTAFAPDGASAVYGAGREVAVVTVPELQIARRLRAPCRVLSVSAALDGSIAAGCQDGAVVVWDPSGRPLRTLRERGAERAYVSFSPDGSRLVAGTSDGKARVWNVATGALERTLAGHRDALTSARYSSDGSAIATASIDHDVRIWDVESGHGRVFAGHYGRVNDARFSPDGRWIVTAGPGGGGLWDVQSGELFSFLRGHDGQLTSAAFDAASRRIVTAGRDGTVRTYVCDICADVEGLVLLAEGRLGLE